MDVVVVWGSAYFTSVGNRAAFLLLNSQNSEVGSQTLHAQHCVVCCDDHPVDSFQGITFAFLFAASREEDAHMFEVTQQLVRPCATSYSLCRNTPVSCISVVQVYGMSNLLVL